MKCGIELENFPENASFTESPLPLRNESGGHSFTRCRQAACQLPDFCESQFISRIVSAGGEDPSRRCRFSLRQSGGVVIRLSLGLVFTLVAREESDEAFLPANQTTIFIAWLFAMPSAPFRALPIFFESFGHTLGSTLAPLPPGRSPFRVRLFPRITNGRSGSGFVTSNPFQVGCV